MKKKIIILIIFIFLLFFVVFNQDSNFENIIKNLPATTEKIGTETIMPFWQKSLEWVKEKIWLRFVNLTNPELEKRKEYMKQGFEQEKDEIKEGIQTEIPKTSQSLWQKFKNLISND